jgi:hypothetical protein
VHGAAGRNLVAAARRNEEDKNERKREREREAGNCSCAARSIRNVKSFG